MRPRRLVTAGIAVLSLAGAAHAAAAPAKPMRSACAFTSPRGGPVESLDIVGGDFAASAREIVATLRLASTDTTGEPTSVLGARWTYAVSAHGIDLAFNAQRGLGPAGTYSASLAAGGGQLVPGVTLTVTPDSLVWRVPRKNVRVLKPGALFVADRRATSSMAGATADSAAAGPCKTG